MRLSGEVVLKAVEDWKDKVTGESKQAFKLYLKPIDPREGATEVSVPEDVYGQVNQAETVSFDVALGVRSFGSGARLFVRYLGNIEQVKAKKA